jgi:hypothetical protein
MPFTPASASSVLAFVAILVAVLVAFIAAVHRAYRTQPATRARLIALALIYLILVGVVVDTGVLVALPLQGLPFFFGTVLVVSLLTGLSPAGGRMAATTPVAALVAFQAFRLPLELILHGWVEQGTIPETMTWSGQNWDVISGIVAVVAAPLASRSRAAAWAANLIGAILLMNVMRVAMMSSPLPFGWGVEPPLLLGLFLPYAWIGPVCVGGALIGHIVLTRALLPGGGAGARKTGAMAARAA